MQSWKKNHSIPDLNVTLADVLQKEATPQDFLDHIDITDWLLRYKTRPMGADGKRHSKDFRMAAKYLSPENLDNVEALIDELGLMFLGTEKIEEPEELGSDDG